MNDLYPLQRFCRACFTICAVAFSGLSGPPAAADEMLAVSEGDFLGELPVVLSVSRLTQATRDAPAAVTVIDAEMIRASGARELADLLRLVPGFQVAYGDLGSPMVVYHGYLTEDEPRRLQVLVDGRSQYSPAFVGAVNWNTVDVQLQDIERIEIVRGTNGATYGSNAFLGVINVITRNAAATQGVEAYVASGNQGVDDQSVRLGLRLGSGFARISAEDRQDEGLPTKSYDDRRTKRAHLRLDQAVGPADSIELSLGQTVADIGQQGSNGGVPPDRTREYSSEHLQAVWRHSFSSGSESQLRLLRATDRSKDTLLLSAFGLSTLFDHSLKAVREEVEGQYLFGKNELRAVLGGSYRNDSTNSRQFYGDDRNVEQTIWRGFGSIDWRINGWLAAHAATTLENDSISGTNWSPRLMLNARPRAGHTLRLGASRGNRVPTIFEEYGREDYFDIATGILIDSATRSSGELRPETIDSYEIGYLFENTRDHFTLDLRAFDERIEDAILWYQMPLPAPGGCEALALLDSPPACGYTRNFTNAGQLRIRGVEYQARWQPIESTRITFNQALIDSESRITDDSIPTVAGISSPAQLADHLQRAAPRRAQSWIIEQALMSRIDLFVAWHYVGPHKTTPGNEVDEYRRLDWRIAYRFRLHGSDAELAYTVQSEGRPHIERKGGALRIANGTADYLTPRAWLSFRIDL